MLLTCTISMQAWRPECLSHPVVLWDSVGHLLTCYQYASLPSCCTVRQFGNQWACIINMEAWFPEYLSHPTVLWDSVGINGYLLTCIINMQARCTVGQFGNQWALTCMYYQHASLLSGVSVPRHCTVGQLGNQWALTNMYYQCDSPECLSHPVVLVWESMDTY